MEKLAINAGKPVRETMLNPSWPGALLYDEKEADALYEVCKKKAPFRYYGFNKPTEVNSFEEEFSKRIGSKYALAVTSGTAALIVALKAAGIGPGDKVIVPACTFLATAGAVICAGAVPIFADVDDTLNIDPEKIGSIVDKYTKALITVPLLGNPCQMDEIMCEAKKHNLIVIEDVAQSMGSALNGKCMGTWGDIGVFSLQMNKLITTGEGGVVVTDNPEIYERAVRYHDQGMFRNKDGFLTEDAENVIIGQNYRMSEFTGAVARAQLKKLDTVLDGNRRVKKALKDGLQGIEGISFKRVIDEEGDASSALVMFLPTKEKAGKFINAVRKENIFFSSQYGGRPVYMIPQIFYKKTVDRNGFPFNQFDEEIVYTKDMCPVAIDLMPKNAFLFLTPDLTDKDIEDIITAVKKITSEIL